MDFMMFYNKFSLYNLNTQVWIIILYVNVIIIYIEFIGVEAFDNGKSRVQIWRFLFLARRMSHGLE